jgi:23S rRNA (cytidine1920-2'-O)/16S rRNA (cytidine1409-2'-O)-methyltransferase
MTDKPKKRRLDAAVVEEGLAESRARAQALIGGGAVTVNGEVVTKSGASVDPGARVELIREPMPYVSRGGLKLQHALDRFDLSVDGRVAADVGASTGGFTDVLLRSGARRVYAIDVGYGQLAWQLRNDERVVVMERTNIRHLEGLPEPIDVAVVDTSFISLRQVLPAVSRLLMPSGDAVVLIKPQFEAGREQVGRKGVVRSAAVWAEVLFGVLEWALGNGWSVLGLERSPIHGPAGNVEFLAHLRLGGGASIDLGSAISRVLKASDGE